METTTSMTGWWSQPPAFLPRMRGEEPGPRDLSQDPGAGVARQTDTGTSSGGQSREARSREGSGRKTRRGQQKSGAEPHGGSPLSPRV